MFDRDVVRMVQFKDLDDASIRRIQARTLVHNGNDEIVRVEHAVALSRALPNAKLGILPGRHSEYLGTWLRRLTDVELSAMPMSANEPRRRSCLDASTSARAGLVR
jgi:hypothetical protein